MRIRHLDPMGVEVSELRLADVDAAVAARLRGLLADRGVLVLPGQDADDAAFLAFLRAFGALAFTVGETPVPGFADLNVVSNVGRATPPRSGSTSTPATCVGRPRTRRCGPCACPSAAGRRCSATSTGRTTPCPPTCGNGCAGAPSATSRPGCGSATDDEASAEHPVFRPHPLSGRTALYISTQKRCAAISGLEQAEAEEAVAFLIAHSTREDNLYRHRWTPGDVVMWDNGCVLHKADHDGVDGDRVMHRGMVAGYAA